MDASNKSKYAHWKSNGSTTHNNSNNTQSHKFHLRYDSHKYSNKPRLQSSNNKYSVDLNRLLHDKNNKNNQKKSSSSTSETSPNSQQSISASTSTSTSFANRHNNITTRYQSRSSTSVPLTKRMHSNTTHSTSNNNKNINNYHHNKRVESIQSIPSIPETKDNTDDNIISDKFKNINLNSRNKFMLSSNNQLFLNKDNKDNKQQHINNINRSISNYNKNKQISSKPSSRMNRLSDTQYNLSLIRPSDRVVLYSPAAHCYVCVSDFEENEMDTMYNDDIKKDGGDDIISNYSSSLYLKCDDMEGTALLIGETQFCGTCKFLADCKIQLIDGHGLYKDKNRIIIHSKHATKFMLQRYDNLSDTGSMMIGHRVLIFVEASRSNRKQFWSYNDETQSIILSELTSSKPTENEIFILQKYGQPLRLKDDDINIINNNNNKQYHDGYIIDNFFNNKTNKVCATSHIQEFYLCHDILRVLSRNNFNGDFIEFTHDAVYGFPKLIFNPSKYGILPILGSAINALSLLIENTAQVRYFVDIHSSTEYGVVSQALCAQISVHLKDFNILLVQLETRLNRNELTLQNMRYYLQRASRTMSALKDICYDIHLNRDKKMNITSSISRSWSIGSMSSMSSSISRDRESEYDKYDNIIPLGSRGGALLNMIQKHIDHSGEKHVRILYNKLMRASCLPYFEMLSNWIYRGIITDIYFEFMISEKTHLKKEDVAQEYNNEYWTGRYSLNRLQIPCILYEYQDIIVTTGKYLNVQRESGYWIETEQKHKELHECNSRELGEFINNAYNFASKALLEMLMNRERIMDRFESIGKYMLLQCGDWFCYFMDMAQSILIGHAVDIKKTKLDRLLELSMRTSNSSKNDPFKDDVCCDIKNRDLNRMIMLLHDIRSNNKDKDIDNMELQQLTGIEAFALNYKVRWPASIIFTGRNVIRYQLIFRFLFKLKYVSRQLKESWKEQMSLRELNLFNTHNQSLMLRYKMLSFIDNLLFYISYQVIQPNWNQFINSNKFKTVDSLLSEQEIFLRKTLEQCLLTNKNRIDSLFKILICCESYSNFVMRYTSDWKIYETTKINHKSQRKTALNMLAKDCRDNLLTSNFINSIQKYNKSFQESVKFFLNDLQKSNNSNININVLLSRLDFNAYYIPKLSFS